MPTQSADKPWTRAAIDWGERFFGIKGYGYAASGHVPGSDHYTGNAVDWDVPGADDGGHPTGAAKSLGDRIAAWFLGNPAIFGTKYVIWNGQIAEPGQPWRAYSGANNHGGHVHVSLDGDGGAGEPPAGTDTTADTGGGLTGGLVAGAQRIAIESVLVLGALGLVALGIYRTTKRGQDA